MKLHLFISMILILLLNGCSKQQIESSYIPGKITVDGDGSDWESHPLTYDEDFNFVYGALNNDSTFYIMFRFNDFRMARIMGSRGITLWLDKEKKFGIRYQDMRLEGMAGNRNDRRNPGAMKIFIPGGTFTIVAEDTVLYPSLQDYPGLKAAFNVHEGLFCFEYAIPCYEGSKIPANLSFKNSADIGFELAEVPDRLWRIAAAT